MSVYFVMFLYQLSFPFTEISLKQRLIEQLEMQQRKMALMQANYEDKIVKLHSMIKATALERDEVVASISSLSSQSTDKVEKVGALERDEVVASISSLLSQSTD